MHPDETLSILGCAISEHLFSPNKALPPNHNQSKMAKVKVRLLNYGPISRFSDLRANRMGHYVSIRGTVVRVGSVRPMLQQVAFLCLKCLQSTTVICPDGVYKTPSRCGKGHCNSKTFAPERGHFDTLLKNWQMFKLQQNMDETCQYLGETMKYSSSEVPALPKTPSGGRVVGFGTPNGSGEEVSTGNGSGNDDSRVPRTIECEVSDDLVDLVTPGDTIIVSGILKASGALDQRKGVNALSTPYTCYLDVNSIVKAKRAVEDLDCAKGNIEIVTDSGRPRVDAGLGQMLSMVADKDFVKMLVASFCPLIYGNELVKCTKSLHIYCIMFILCLVGLLLVLFGGTRRCQQSCENSIGCGGVATDDPLTIRSESHILLIGDPGLGKSQLISAASQIAPRGVYVCGNTSTSAGLTATVVSDTNGGYNGMHSGHSLEAGALVLADQGCCCIDEFDKISEHRILLDVMEQQVVNVAKAGIVCSLPARTSVIAAANPIGGHYNQAKSVVENLKMDPALLSRFDLVFILLDRPNYELDRMLSEHVLANFGEKKRNNSEDKLKSINIEHRFVNANSPTDTPIMDRIEVEATLLYRISYAKEASEGFKQMVKPLTAVPFSSSLLRTYIGHVRENCHPRMTREAARVIQSYYLSLRQRQSINIDESKGSTTNFGNENYDTIPVTARHLEALIRLSEARARMACEPYVTAQHAQDVVELM